MEQNETLFKDMLDNLYDAVYLVDESRVITFWNKGAEQLTGYTREEVIQSRCSDGILNHIDTKGNMLCKTSCPLSQTLADGKLREAEVLFKHKDGHRIPVHLRVSPIRGENGAITGAIEIFSDNSKQLAYESQIKSLQRLALLDHTTGLFNRRFMEIKLGTSIEELRAVGIPIGVFLAGIDRLNSVNDKYGNEVGDRVIVSVAKTMRANAKGVDYLGRWSCDEFLGIMSNAEENEVFSIANSLRAIVGKIRIPVDKTHVGVVISIGATCIQKEDTVAKIIERIDAMLKFSNQSGGNKLSMKTKKIV